MGNVKELISLMHKFTPKGQELALNILKRERAFLASRPSAVMELPSKLANSGELGVLEREMSGNSYISENLYYAWARYADKIEINSCKSFLSKYNKLATQVFGIQRKNQIKPIVENKLKVIEFIEKECKDPTLAKKLQECKTEKEIQECFNQLFNKHLMVHVSEVNYKGMMTSKNLEYFKDAYDSLLKRGDLVLKFWKMILPEINDKRVLEITDILKYKYGMKYVHLESAKDAEKMLKAVEFAQKKNIPIPENVIMTSAFPLEGGQNVLTSNLEHTVFMNSQRQFDIFLELLNKKNYSEKILNYIQNLIRQIKGKEQIPTHSELLRCEILGAKTFDFSTPHELHNILHEFEHSRNFVFSNIKIPKKHVQTVNGLMNYSAVSYNKINDEVRNELMTKRDIMGLNPQEESLLKLWG